METRQLGLKALLSTFAQAVAAAKPPVVSTPLQADDARPVTAINVSFEPSNLSCGAS